VPEAVDTVQLDDDERRLSELGYKQELNRSWSGFSNFAISFSIISILAGCFTSFGLGWNNGGPAAIAWGWPIISAFILVIGMCMAELVSAYPTSGGIYWWASKLGGPKAGYYTRLAQSDWSPGHRGLRGVRLRHLLRPDAGLL
jgi:amino acid transporter